MCARLKTFAMQTHCHVNDCLCSSGINGILHHIFFFLSGTSEMLCNHGRTGGRDKICFVFRSEAVNLVVYFDLYV